MGTFVIYILEWSACLLLFLLLYKMCFSGTTFHRFNRIFLLGSVVLSAVLPLIHIVPTTQMEPVAEVCRTTAWVDPTPLSTITIQSTIETQSDKMTPAETGAALLLVAYLLYIIIQLTGWGKSCAKMLWFLRGKRSHRVGRWIRLVEHDGEYGPFSWMNFIVISSSEQGFGRRASIRHELSHILLLHHLDLLLLMICVIINPTCWLVMKEIKVIHEYEADDEVINHYRIQSRDYQRLLILRTVGAEAYALASSFNLNIKKRIIMMKKKQSHWWRMTWIVITLPLISFTLMAFSKPKDVLKEVVDNSMRKVEQPIVEVMNSDMLESESDVVELQAPAKKEAAPKAADDVKPGDVIKGTVKGHEGQALQKATVVETDEYGRMVATGITDSNGNFSLKVVNPKHKVRVSYVGYKSASLNINGNTYNVKLEPATIIEAIQVKGRTINADLEGPRYGDQSAVNAQDQSFNFVEQMPKFPGGNAELMSYLEKNLRYPSAASEMRVEGTVIVTFVVDKTGFVRSPKIAEVRVSSPIAKMTDVNSPSRTVNTEFQNEMKEGDEAAAEKVKAFYDTVEAMKEEAIHVVRNMPRWEPARQNGKRVETTYTLPVSFKLQ